MNDIQQYGWNDNIDLPLLTLKKLDHKLHEFHTDAISHMDELSWLCQWD
jgi:hypothetical protein